MRILVIDDDPAIQQLMLALLRRCDVMVDVCGDGEEARSMITAEIYDSVVLDLMLPRASGFELLEHVRRTRPDLLDRIVIVTAASDLMLRKLPETNVRLLRKPFDIQDFVKVVLRRDLDGDSLPDSLVV